MVSKLDEAKAEVLERAAEAAGHSPVAAHGMGDEALAVLLRRYYRHVSPEDMIGRDPVDVYAAAVSHQRLAASRPQGVAKVRVFTPTVEEYGWAAGHTVVEIVTDDMPFLVDSVTAELSRQNRAIHLVIHPQLIVRRDVVGELLEICDVSDPAAAPAGAMVESWMHVEIDRETDRDDLAKIEADLRAVLRDVREVNEDWPKMRAAARRLAEELGEAPPPVPAEETADAQELLRWLADEHFTFLGYREYDLVDQDGEEVLRAVTGTGLGILRSDQPMSVSFSQLTAEGRAKARERRLLVLTKANSRATVHRPAYLDYIGVKKFDQDGAVVGERRILGLFSAAAYTDSVRRIPVLRRRVDQVLAQAGFPATSHSGKDLLQILETYPRDELFQVSVDELLPVVTAVLHLQERRRLRLFLRKDSYGRYYSALVYFPRDRYNTAVRTRMQDILLEELHGTTIDYTVYTTESVLSRLHFVVRVPPGESLADVDAEHIESRLAEATRSWMDDFAEALADQCGEERAAELGRRWSRAIPEGYKADFPARTAVADIARVEELAAEGDFTMNLYEPIGARPGEKRFKIYRTGDPISLTQVLPVLGRMGFEVTDERPYEFRVAGGVSSWVYDFGLRYDPQVDAGAGLKQLFQEAFAAIWTGVAESDGFNALVLRAGLTWRQAMVLRAYAKYLRQGGSTFSQDYIETCLTGNVHIAKLLVRLFEARTNPAYAKAGSEVSDGLVEEITGALDQVASLDQDRILRAFLRLIQATLRTNYFQHGDDGAPKPYLSIKFDPTAIPDLPAPRPRYEIWVYSPQVEGVHLRFGAVARGGLRWSDRREDFRTEILGLVKAQMVKNTVIVPVGAKGGFVGKRLPDPADREAWLAEGVACYRTFIRGLLDITDNLVGGEVVPPPDVVRHDGDDTYLVVAADKGTATFSDIANGVAAEYGFWLGDAFASGGSVGYDHKAMGITARGAWESVKRHFRELGHDTQNADFTVVGIGDMSGDVFGNGMLLSRHIRLIAAFDHRHIFIDPDPDTAVSYAERERLFALPRSSWADYDVKLISAGGGVYSRAAKSIPISAPVRTALGLSGKPARLTPNELMKAIIAAPVDLLWNGGIGTYVKGSTETHAEVGDKANDAIRVNGDQVRARVVGEGGNLGLTQLGRIEYALAGGRVNTDAIDNSAGVDTSDHEVNIKILLDAVVAGGDMTEKQRNELLAGMTDEVAALVLRNNYGQNVALASAAAQAPSMLNVHSRYLRRLERDGHLDRALEFLPTERQIGERRSAGVGLTQPELAVLLAYTKITLAEELLASDLPEDEFLLSELRGYFPTPLRERFRDQMMAHPLRREIVVTGVVNNFVNNAGSTALFRLRDETGASAEEIARAHTVARFVYDLQSHWDAVEALDNKVDAQTLTRIRLDARRLAERATRWLLNNRTAPLGVAEQIHYFSEGVREVVANVPKLLRGNELAQFERRREELLAAGAPFELAANAAAMNQAYGALDIVDVARDSGRSVIEVADVYFDLADRLRIGLLLERIVALPRTDRWKTIARAALREDVYEVHAALAFDVLASGPAGASPNDRYEEWRRHNTAVVERARQMLEDILTADAPDLATLSVGLRVIRTMIRTHQMS